LTFKDSLYNYIKGKYMPKKIGGRLYLHRNYIRSLDINTVHEVAQALRVSEDILGGFIWNTLRIKPDGIGGASEIAFQYSPDFDTADEPSVTNTVLCRKNEHEEWIVKDVLRHKDTIWHHKWQWVGPDYKGFDYNASKKRSALWKPFVSKEEIPKIGNKNFWDKIRVRWDK
jgi:hypothetical protein